MQAEKASWREVVSSSGWRGRGLLGGKLLSLGNGACGGGWWTEVIPGAWKLLRQKGGEGQGREGQVALNKEDM